MIYTIAGIEDFYYHNILAVDCIVGFAYYLDYSYHHDPYNWGFDFSGCYSNCLGYFNDSIIVLCVGFFLNYLALTSSGSVVAASLI